MSLELMVPDLKSENSALESRLRSRLLWCRAIVCVLLGGAGIAWFTLELTESQNIWGNYGRPILASLLLTCIVIENILWQFTSEKCIANSSETNTREDKERKFLRWKFLLSARTVSWLTHLTQLGLTALTTLLAIKVVAGNFSASTSFIAPENGHILAVSLLLALCFILLVCERMLSFRRIRQWSEQMAAVGLLRALLSICLLVMLALFVSMFSATLAYWVMVIADGIVLLIAAEFLLRTIAAACVMPTNNRKPVFVTQSFIAEQYRWPLHPLLMLRKKIMQHFGVDVGQIQAFRLMGKILLPVVCGIAITGWLASCLNEVSANQRGVYERFGRPVAVLSSGLHVGLPWPFGRVIPVDYGAVHELQLSDNAPTQEEAAFKITDPIEGPAPQESWRLWDNTHTTDQAQVIASALGDKQSFQIVNMDIRIIWRVGMKDADAMNSLYQTDDLPTTIQRIARQVLTQYFAHQQLDSLLNEQRATMSVALNQEIQKRLNRLNSGVELLYTRVESIHPPAGAANAYHGVQAAQIAASAQIAREKGYSFSLANDAQRKATTAINSAEASANELQAKANNAMTRYSAEHNAWKINPDAYLNERRYQTYSRALSGTPLLIIDSQLTATNEPMLDLRQFSQPSR
ncbi:protease modulator HflK [Dryocola sp. LX212]|jgi:regulator of protease activity HflC (stomatin/prohibitin superfamily)